MFFQLELVKIAQTPHPPSAILIVKTKPRGTVNDGALHLYGCSVREVFFGFAGHLELFAGHLIEFNSSSSPDILKIRWTCPASLANFA